MKLNLLSLLIPVVCLMSNIINALEKVRETKVMITNANIFNGKYEQLII